MSRKVNIFGYCWVKIDQPVFRPLIDRAFYVWIQFSLNFGRVGEWTSQWCIVSTQSWKAINIIWYIVDTDIKERQKYVDIDIKERQKYKHRTLRYTYVYLTSDNIEVLMNTLCCLVFINQVWLSKGVPLCWKCVTQRESDGKNLVFQIRKVCNCTV